MEDNLWRLDISLNNKPGGWMRRRREGKVGMCRKEIGGEVEVLKVRVRGGSRV